MMTANEFFGNGPEPLWLVDACEEGEVISANSQFDFLYDGASSSSAGVLGLSQGAGPSNSAGNSVMHMDEMELDDVPEPQVVHTANPHGQFQQFTVDPRQQLQGMGPTRLPELPGTMFEDHRGWSNRPTPNRAATMRRFAPAPADLFLRACKKRKHSHFMSAF